MPRAMGKSATTTEFDHAVGRTVQRCEVYDPRCGFREEVVDKEETLRSSGGGGVDGNAQSSLEDCRVRMCVVQFTTVAADLRRLLAVERRYTRAAGYCDIRATPASRSRSP